MATKIIVEQKEESAQGWVFAVTLADQNGQTVHTASLSRKDYQRLTESRISPQRLVETSFQFLLGREPKESILRRFNLVQIGDYFPEYDGEISRRK